MTVGPFLEPTARARAVVTYQEVINACPPLPPLEGEWNSHPLSRIFEMLDQEDAQNQRPFRTSVVINGQSFRPGLGFFEALERLKGIQCLNDAARETAWIAELNAAHAFNWP